MAYITPAEFTAYVGSEIPADQAFLQRCIDAAEDAVNDFCGRTFDDSGAPSPRTYYARTALLADVDDFHTITGLVVATDEDDDGTFETTWAATDFQLEPLNGLQNGLTVPWRRIRAVESRFFPCGRRPSLQVTARWGWAAPPPKVKEATAIVAKDLAHMKNVRFGVMGFGETAIARLRGNPQVQQMLAPLRLLAVG